MRVVILPNGNPGFWYENSANEWDYIVDKLVTFTELQTVSVSRSHAGAFFSQSKVKVLAALLIIRVKDDR
jgi:hypothetical protein